MNCDPNSYYSLPVFDYSSAFSYRRKNRDLVEDDDGYDDPFNQIDDSTQSNNGGNWFEKLIYFFLVSLSVLFFIVTFPVSSFFCIKKIPSLQRCLIYRLGRRLPLKGPGFIVQLPYIDKVSIIDLYETRFNLIDQEQQFMTGDGSIILMKPCQATLNVSNALLTTLKINNINVKELLKLRFGNLIRSKHVEDLECKMDFTLKQFEENINEFLKKWGYSVSMIEPPRITVIDRADPINPIKNKLRKLLNPDENAIKTNEPFENFLTLFTPDQLNQLVSSNPTKQEASTENLIPILQSFLNQYQTYLRSYENFNIKLIVHDQQVYYFRCHQDNIESSPETIDPIHMTINFKSKNDFEQFLLTKDIKYISFRFN